MHVYNKKIFVYGKKPVFEILRSSHPVDSLTIAREIDPKDLHSIIKLANKRKIEIEYLPKSNLQRLCGPVLHQGMVAIIPGFHYIHETELMQKLDATKNPLVLILDQIQDTHNMGAIIRTAEVVGVSAIVLAEKGSSDINATVAKTSAGAIFHIPILRSPNLMGFMGKLSELKIKTAALVPVTDTSIYAVNLNEPLALVIGNEQKGVRKNIRGLCDLKISIPQWGRIGSLNASVSVGIVLYEVMRQRKVYK